MTFLYHKVVIAATGGKRKQIKDVTCHICQFHSAPKNRCSFLVALSAKSPFPSFLVMDNRGVPLEPTTCTAQDEADVAYLPWKTFSGQRAARNIVMNC